MMMHYENDFWIAKIAKYNRNSNVIRSTEANNSSNSDSHIYFEIDGNNEVKLELPVRRKAQKCYPIATTRRKITLILTGIIIVLTIVPVVLYSIHSTKENKGAVLHETLDVECKNHMKRRNCTDCSNFQMSKSVMCCIENICTEKNIADTMEINHNYTVIKSDSKGTQFLLVFPEQYNYVMARSKLLIATDMATVIWVYSSRSGRNISTIINSSEPYYNPDIHVVTVNGINKAGIEVNSEVPMSMYGFIQNALNDNSERYLALPVRYAANSYIVPSFTVSKFRGISFTSKSIVTISPLQLDTKIQINLRMKSGSLVVNNIMYRNNDTMSITLQRHETFQLSHSSDLTGTMVTANKRFLLTSGNICSYMNNIGSCNPFLEMILPITQLDKYYVIPKIATRHIYTVRILAVHFTIAKIKLGENLIKKELNARHYYDFNFTNSSSVTASDDVMVIVYPHEEASTRSNSFMMTIHGTNQYLNEYLFVVPDGFSSFISVVVEMKDNAGFILDDMPVTNDIFDQQSLISESVIFSTFSIKVKSGRHKLIHLKGSLFGLWVYGNAEYDGYGFPAGIAMKTRV